MTDVIQGPVIDVIDGDTFEIEVAKVGKDNEYEYNEVERIRIADIDAPELNTGAGKRSKAALQRKLKGKEVRCDVQARDKYGRIIAKVKPV